MKPIQVLLGVACCVTSAMAAEYYTEPQLYGLRPNPGAENELGPIGVTGIEARIAKGMQVTVVPWRSIPSSAARKTRRQQGSFTRSGKSTYASKV